MSVSDLLEQPCNKSDIFVKLVTSCQQVWNNLLTTWYKQCEHMLLTACLQTCYKLWDFYVCTTELYYIWRKHANLSSAKQLKPKRWRISDESSRHLTPYLWQRLKVVTPSQAQFWARSGFHTPLEDMLIFFAVNFYFCQWEWFWWFWWFIYDFTIYSKMYNLFIVYLALERNGKLIKSWKCRQLQDFWGDGEHQPELFEVLYLTGIWKLEFLSFKFIFSIFMLNVALYKICKLGAWIYSTVLHWMYRFMLCITWISWM